MPSQKEERHWEQWRKGVLKRQRTPYLIRDLDKTHGILKLTFNRPEKLNACLFPDWEEFISAMEEAAVSPDVKIIILTGAGSCFGTGQDVEEIIEENIVPDNERPRPQGYRIAELRNSSYGRRGFSQTVQFSPKVTIAQVHGYCYGGHFQFVCGCDIIIASEDASFVHPGYRYVGPMGEDMVLMMHRMGLGKLKEMMFTGRPLDAQEALECGLVNKVVPRDCLEEETTKMARLISLQAADSLVIGKANFGAALAIVGCQASASTGTVAHLWQHMMRSEPGEYNLIRTSKGGNIRAALSANKEYFKDSPIAKPKR